MMGVWDVYEDISRTGGKSKREKMLTRERDFLSSKLPNNLSWHSVLVQGAERDVAVINTDNLNTKHIFSLRNEIACGDLVEWMGNKWLVTEKDANNEVYTKAIMIQCNYLIKWVDDESKIHEQWCVIEDGTKYLTGELEDRNFVVTRGDTRVSLTIARNENTVKLKRGQRFVIDDPLSEHKMTYLLTKPLKVGKVYNNEGVFMFVLQEVVSTDDDNQDLNIADYYEHFPNDSAGGSDNNNEDISEKKGWI